MHIEFLEHEVAAGVLLQIDSAALLTEHSGLQNFEALLIDADDSLEAHVVLEFFLYFALDDGEITNGQQNLVVHLGLATAAPPQLVVGLLGAQTHLTHHFALVMQLLRRKILHLVLAGVDLVHLSQHVDLLSHRKGVLQTGPWP